MKSRRPLYAVAGCTLLGCLFASSSASAQAVTFGMPGTWVIAAEDLTGYYSEHRTYRGLVSRQFPQGPETTLSQNYFSFALRTGARVGVHYFIIPSLSVGGMVGYESRAGSDTHEDTPGTWTHDSPTASSFILEPKAGYALMITPAYGFWFRGGLGYRYDSQTFAGADDKLRDWAFFLTADILFVAAPIPHLGVFVGPTADISFLGYHGEYHPPPLAQPGAPPEDWSHKESYNRLGGAVGLMGYF